MSRTQLRSYSILLPILSSLLVALSTIAAAETIWIEGEAPTKSTFRKHGWYDAVKKDVLSGQDWLSHYGDMPGEASYTLSIEEPGEYALWVRCNPTLVTQHYKLDDGGWTPCDLKSDAREEMMISDKVDHRFLSWNKLGKHKLATGEHTISFRLSSKISNHGGIDCFVLTSRGFVPTGARKPGAAGQAGPADWFEVVVDEDVFSPQSAIDMSHLLHKPAGKFGPVVRRGEALLLAGKPVKFWGCGANVQGDKPRPWQQHWARYLAKHGVNMVRQHTVQEQLGLLEKNAKTGQRELNAERLDQFDWWFAELKKQGIYMTWSVFYPHKITRDEGYDLFDDLPKVGGNAEVRSTSGVVNIEPKLQDAEWAYLQKVLIHKNPYTGLRYVDDPALAVIEVHNEDCVFFHAPLNQFEAGKEYVRHAERLKLRWAEWLKRRYTDDAGLKKAWGAGLRSGDSVGNPRMAIYGAWEMQADGPARNKQERRRLGDFIRYLAEQQRAYFERREKELRDLGFKAVTVSTAWRAGGAAADAANLWCDDALDMIDRHNYFGGGAGGHNIKEGEVHNATHLSHPGGGLLASGLYQIEDKPFAMTEWTSLPPNQWKAEAAPLLAFYGLGLQGWDASYHFLSSRNAIGGGWPNLSSYVTDTPHYIGQFPALAFALHKGHIQEAPIVAARRLNTDSLFQGIDSLQQDFTGGGYDAKSLQGNQATPPEVLAIGRVTARFGDKLPHAEKVDWSKAWDQERKVITSLTGELRWDYGRRIVTLSTPKTQAVIGFAGGTTQKLSGASLDIKTPFVSLIFTPLDDLPLEKSKHILITAMSQDRQAGAKYNDDGSVLVQAGGPPLLMQPVEATVTLRGAAPRVVRALDFAGVPTDKSLPIEGNSFAIDGRYQTYYYEVLR